MSTLEQLHRGLHRIGNSLAEGWQHLSERAGHALTRFTPKHSGEVQTLEDQAMLAGSRWGLLGLQVT